MTTRHAEHKEHDLAGETRIAAIMDQRSLRDPSGLTFSVREGLTGYFPIAVFPAEVTSESVGESDVSARGM